MTDDRAEALRLADEMEVFAGGKGPLVVLPIARPIFSDTARVFRALARAPVAEGWRVKPLGWIDREASTGFGVYSIDGDPGHEIAVLERGFYDRRETVWSSEPLDTEDEAKAAAQADFAARVTACLDAPLQRPEGASAADGRAGS